MIFILVSAVCLVLVFYIVGCRDIDFSMLQEFDCEEAANQVEGVSCGEEEWVEVDDDHPNNGAGITDGPGNPGGGNNFTPGDGPPGSGENPPSVGKPPTKRIKVYTNKISIHLGRVNILFVVDNSPSMRQELQSIAHQFDRFLTGTKLKNMDYRIGIITTDSRRDRGGFYTFPNGEKYLSNPSGSTSIHENNVRYFQQTVQVSVDDEIRDERGIYAVNQALDNAGFNNFFRPHSLLMVIFVSDEDERSYGGRVPEGFYDLENRVLPLEQYDQPETFFLKANVVHNKFVTIVAHSIVSDGRTCGGVEGRIYKQASNPSQSILNRFGNIRRGYIGSVCSRNYSSQLGSIADYLDKMPPISLPCAPHTNSVRVHVDGRSQNFRLNGRQVELQGHVSYGAFAEIWYRCLNNSRF